MMSLPFINDKESLIVKESLFCCSFTMLKLLPEWYQAYS